MPLGRVIEISCVGVAAWTVVEKLALLFLRTNLGLFVVLRVNWLVFVALTKLTLLLIFVIVALPKVVSPTTFNLPCKSES